MTRRPERLKATKLYAPVQLTDKHEQAEGGNDKHATGSEPSLKIKPRPTQVADKRGPKPNNTDKNNNIVDTNTFVSKSEIDPVTNISKPKEHGKKETSEINSNADTNTRKCLPKGFVTRKEMEEKVNKNSEKKIVPPKGFVTRAEMEQILMEKKPIKDEIHQKISNDPTETDSEQRSKMETITKDISPGPDAKKDLETRKQHRKTKTTKITPAYSYSQLPKQTAQNQPTHHDDKRQQDAFKLDPNAKHLFSKLENKSKGVTVLQDDKKSTDSVILKQNKARGKKDQEAVKAIRDTKPTLQANKKANSETVDSKTKPGKLTKDKMKTGLDKNDAESMASVSTRKSSITITPRMTSTAIGKPTRGYGNSNILGSVQLDSVKILIMNANGKDDRGGSPAERRRNAIHDVVLKHMPNIVLFQEFSWTGIRGKTWVKYPIPEQFVYKGHYDASIMYDDTCITVHDLPASDIDTILSGLRSNSNNRLKRTFPMDFNPVARICISRITAPTKPGLDLICISWHGKSNETGGGRMKELKKIEYFEYFMEFLRNIREKYKLPILAAGDYNVDMYSIETYVQSPFKLCIYEASMRRTVRGIVDFCIVTDDIELKDISWVNLERDTTAFHPNEILDHDPVVGSLTVSALAASEAALGIGKKKAWPSPIAKHK